MKRNIKGFLKENWLLVIAAMYVLSPVDIIPDVLPFLGSVDDSIVVIFEIIRQYFQYSQKDGLENDVEDSQ